MGEAERLEGYKEEWRCVTRRLLLTCEEFLMPVEFQDECLELLSQVRGQPEEHRRLAQTLQRRVVDEYRLRSERRSA